MFEPASGDRDTSRTVLTLRRLWWVVVVAAVVSAFGAYLIGSRRPEQYSATAALLLRDTQLDQGLFPNQRP